MMESQRPGASVSVVVATYNRADLLREAVESLLAQTRVPDEIIIVNDGSTDNTKEVVREFGDKIVYLEKSNGGKSSALNMAIPRITSTYTWIFDDDDIALPHALQTHLDFLATHPECDFTYSPMYSFSGDFSIDLLDQYEQDNFPEIITEEFFPWILEAMHIVMQGMLVPTACYHEIGLFDEQLLRSLDYDMVLRIARRFRAGRVEAPTFALRVHAGTRGPGFANHDENQRMHVWQQYDRHIFGHLRKELRLSEYLPRNDLDDSALTPEERRQALIKRAYVMTNHGLLTEALQDLTEWTCDPNAAKTPLTKAEQRLLSVLAQIDNLYQIPPLHFYHRIGAAARRQPSALRWLSRGLYWSYARHIKRPRITARIFSLTCALIGGYVFPSWGSSKRNLAPDNQDI